MSFVSVPARELREDVLAEELPILLAYSGGELVGSEKRVGRSEGAELTTDAVEGELQTHTHSAPLPTPRTFPQCTLLTVCTVRGAQACCAGWASS